MTTLKLLECFSCHGSSIEMQHLICPSSNQLKHIGVSMWLKILVDTSEVSTTFEELTDLGLKIDYGLALVRPAHTCVRYFLNSHILR